jgi:hypothetical protein
MKNSKFAPFSLLKNEVKTITGGDSNSITTVQGQDFNSARSNKDKRP